MKESARGHLIDGPLGERPVSIAPDIVSAPSPSPGDRISYLVGDATTGGRPPPKQCLEGRVVSCPGLVHQFQLGGRCHGLDLYMRVPGQFVTGAEYGREGQRRAALPSEAGAIERRRLRALRVVRKLPSLSSPFRGPCDPLPA